MGIWTQASLVAMVLKRESETENLSIESLKEHFIVADTMFGAGVIVNMEWASSIMEKADVSQKVSVQNLLGISTIMRLLRFLPDFFTDQWLLNLFHLSSQNHEFLEALSNCSDWQPSLFQFISELVEKIAGSDAKGKSDGDSNDHSESPESSDADVSIEITLEKRFHVALALYAALLGHRLREGGDQVSVDFTQKEPILNS